MISPELAMGGLRLRPPLILAPMAGLTHTAFRRLVMSLGGIALYTTEMLSARSLPVEDPAGSPYLARDAAERPLSYQLLVSHPDEVAPALEILHRVGADAVDINLGCPAPQARRRGAGAWLMDRLAAAREVVAEARRRTSLPLSAKIRLGQTLDEGALQDRSRMLQDEGVDLIAVHARLRGDPYGRPARWEWIGKVKSSVSVPVVGNGGIFSAADARRCLEVSGCDGLMLGRGTAVRPWLAAEIARDVYGIGPGVPEVSRPGLYRRFVRFLEEGIPPGRRLGRLKEFTHYFSQTYAFGHHLASAVQSSRSLEEALGRTEEFFRGAEECPDPGRPPS